MSNNGNGNMDTGEDLMDMPPVDEIETNAELQAAGIAGGYIDAEGILKRGNGIITRGETQQYRSLMKSLISHIKTGDDLLDLVQELKVGNYLSAKEADLVTAAIGENFEVPHNLQMIMIWVINRGSVNNQAVQNVIKGLTHTSTSFNSNRVFNWGKNKRNGNNASQIPQ